jgi:hypothetical protein
MKKRWGALAVAGLFALSAHAQAPGTGTGQSGERVLEATLLKLEGATAFLEHTGAVVPMQIGPGTQVGQVQPGAPVQARFRVENDDTNVLLALTPGMAAGPMQPGVGGAGTAGQGDDEEGTFVVEPLNEAAEQMLDPSLRRQQQEEPAQ